MAKTDLKQGIFTKNKKCRKMPKIKYIGLRAGAQRENFPGGTKVDIGPPNLIGSPKPYRGPCR